MRKILIALLAMATIGWYARPANAEYNRGHRSARHGGGGHGGGYGHGGHQGYQHGYHRSNYGHHDRHYYRPHYVPYYRSYVYQPAPYSGFQIHGRHASFGLYW